MTFLFEGEICGKVEIHDVIALIRREMIENIIVKKGCFSGDAQKRVFVNSDIDSLPVCVVEVVRWFMCSVCVSWGSEMEGFCGSFSISGSKDCRSK